MWGACDPNNPRNRRLRCSALIRKTATSEDGIRATICVVDTGPDFRQQMLTHAVGHIDGVIYTHSHADHIHGIDDLRPYALGMRRRINVYADDAANVRLQEAFGYCFHTPPGSSYPPILERTAITPDRKLVIEGPGGSIDCTTTRVNHGDMDALALRFGDVAYLPDIKALPDDAKRKLQGLDVLVIDALRYTPHPSHFNLEQALAVHEDLKPRRTVLTNLHTDLDYETLQRETPATVEPAYDGMKFEVSGHG